MSSVIKNLTREGLEKAFKRLQEKLEHLEEHAILEEDINDFLERQCEQTVVDLAEYQRYQELEDEVLGCRDSYILEKESPYLRYKCEDYTDEDGTILKPTDILTRSVLIECLGGKERFEPCEDDIKLRDICDKVSTYREQRDYFKDDVKQLKEENAKLKKEVEQWRSTVQESGGSAGDIETPEDLEHYLMYCGEPDQWVFKDEHTKLQEEVVELKKKLQLETNRSNALADACDFYEIDTDFLNDL